MYYHHIFFIPISLIDFEKQIFFIGNRDLKYIYIFWILTKIWLHWIMFLQIMNYYYIGYFCAKALSSSDKRKYLKVLKNSFLSKFQFFGLPHMENENMTFSFVIPSIVPHKTTEKVGASWILNKSLVSWTSTKKKKQFSDKIYLAAINLH